MKPSKDYLAAFLDGEGCFVWSGSENSLSLGGTPRVTISNTFLPALEKFREIFGGKIYQCKYKINNRTCFQWYCTGPNARGLCRSMIPYLWEKQEQARLLLRICSVSPMYRKKFLKKLKELKHIDYANN